jgi:hypothetical protein
VPAPIHPAVTPVAFDRDLTTNGNVVKNTIRWKISIKAGVLSGGQYEVDTRIGNQTASGFPNLSGTYFWVNVSPPYTEQFQFTGDPRHCPYLDVKLYGSGADKEYRYNWYFANIPSGDFQGYNKSADGWEGYGSTCKPNIDVPRFFQLYRRGLLLTGGILTPITGWSFYYIGVGGEMGGDASSDLQNGIKIIEKPWSKITSTSVKGINEIHNQWETYDYMYARIIAKTDDSWYSRYWIGELCPDDQWANWTANGNLATGSGNFYRALPTTFGFPFNPTKMNGSKGCTSFFNGTSTGSKTFNHADGGAATGAITTDGNAMASIFNFPQVTPLDANRPFTVVENGNKPPEWSDSEYSGQRTVLSSEKIYYDSSYSSDYKTSEGIKLTLGSTAGYMVMQGVKQQTGFGAVQISRLAMQGILHQFLVSGEPTVAIGRIVQVPLLSISAPLSGQEFINPVTMSIQWLISWKRWDGEKYTSAYADGFSEAEPIVYNIKYSSNNGISWKFVQDGSSAIPGEKDSGYYCSSPYSWDVSSLSGGTYMIRVEGYRQNLPLHYTYQLIRLYISR